MEDHPATQEPFHPYDDLVHVDAYGRGHRPDGKFISSYDIAQIGVHQDQIRDGLSGLNGEYIGQHRRDETFASIQQDITQLPAYEPQINPDKFATNRWDSLRGIWQKAKQLGTNAKAHFAIEYKGYRLSASQNLGARFARLGTLTFRDENNPIVKKAYENRFNTQFSKADWIAFTAYELFTLPVVRSMGALAIKGATRTIVRTRANDSEASGMAGALYRRSSNWLEKYEKNTLNPVDRSKQKRAAAHEHELTHSFGRQTYDKHAVRRDPFEFL